MLFSVRPNQRAHNPIRRSAVFVFALLALVWQGLITPSHFHLRNAACLSVGTWTDCEPLSRDRPHDKRSSGQDRNCMLCHELAVSGHYIAAAGVTYLPPLQVAFWLAEVRVEVGRAQARSHIWQSRAPPPRA